MNQIVKYIRCNFKIIVPLIVVNGILQIVLANKVLWIAIGLS